MSELLTVPDQERARVLGEQLALRAPQEPQNGTLEARGATQPSDPPTGEPSAPWWRSWGHRWPTAIMVLIVLVGALVLLAWPR
jgi:hypothetical protein